MGHRSQHVSNALMEPLRRAETKVEACHRACEELLRKTEVLGGNVKGRILLSNTVLGLGLVGKPVLCLYIPNDFPNSHKAVKSG